MLIIAFFIKTDIIQKEVINVKETDGYIKNKKIEIFKLRQIIFFKCFLCAFIPLIFVFLFLTLALSDPPPKKWQSSDIVFSEIEEFHYYNRYGSDYSYRLVTTSSQRFRLYTKDVAILNEKLVKGHSYSILYAEHPLFLSNYIKAVSDENGIHLSKEASVKHWEQNRKDLLIASWVLLVLSVIIIILADRLWCKKDHREIKRLKERIERRRNRNAEKASTSPQQQLQ